MHAARVFARGVWNWNEAERVPSGQMDQPCLCQGEAQQALGDGHGMDAPIWRSFMGMASGCCPMVSPSEGNSYTARSRTQWRSMWAGLLRLSEYSRRSQPNARNSSKREPTAGRSRPQWRQPSHQQPIAIPTCMSLTVPSCQVTSIHERRDFNRRPTTQ